MLKLWDVEIARSFAVSRIAFIFYGENATNLISARAVRRTPLWGSPQDPLQIVECWRHGSVGNVTQGKRMRKQRQEWHYNLGIFMLTWLHFI